MDNRELMRVIEQASRAAEAAAPAIRQVARAAQAARAMVGSEVFDQAARAAEAAAPAMEHLARAAEAATRSIPSGEVIDQIARATKSLNCFVEQLVRDAPAIDSAMDEFARNAEVFDLVLQRLARDAPTFNRLIEHRAREIGDEALSRMDQGESDASAAHYGRHEIAAHPHTRRWLQRGLRHKLGEFLVTGAVSELLFERLLSLGDWHWLPVTGIGLGGIRLLSIAGSKRQLPLRVSHDGRKVARRLRRVRRADYAEAVYESFAKLPPADRQFSEEAEHGYWMWAGGA